MKTLIAKAASFAGYLKRNFHNVCCFLVAATIFAIYAYVAVHAYLYDGGLVASMGEMMAGFFLAFCLFVLGLIAAAGGDEPGPIFSTIIATGLTLPILYQAGGLTILYPGKMAYFWGGLGLVIFLVRAIRKCFPGQ